MSLPTESHPEKFFKSKAHYYVFVLLNYQGSKMGSSLGICWKHYKNIKQAFPWKESIKDAILEEFKDYDHDVHEALSNLNDYYEKLIEK